MKPIMLNIMWTVYHNSIWDIVTSKLRIRSHTMSNRRRLYASLWSINILLQITCIPLVSATAAKHKDNAEYTDQIYGGVGGLEPTSYSGNLSNVSLLIEELLLGYDIRLRPQFGGEWSGFVFVYFGGGI